MIGKTLGHYEILEPLGAGGMGAVYRARDTNLRRDVAIKVLPEGLASDEGRLARLRREAQLLASVNHPNIAAIYNLEESEGTRWLVLELVEGTTLEEELRRGAMSVGDSLRIGIQVAAALEAAHEKDIVHRDLKPANVMLDARRRVKVLDFGIAKDVSSAEGAPPNADTATRLTADFTAHGVLIGTAPYMSPEQVRGRPVDKRSDNWSFGCLMFELLTGQRPFDRDTVMDTMSAILEHEPDWDLLPENTPEDMEELIRRCLRKDADVRLRDIADVCVQFSEIETAVTSETGGTTPRRRGTAAASGAAGRPAMKVAATVIGALAVVATAGWGLWSALGTERAAPGMPALVVTPIDDIPATAHAIAVMPFVGVPDDAANRSLAVGMADQILSQLMRVSELRPVGGTSASKAAGLALPELGRQLGVSKVLKGSVQRNGDALLLNVRLIDTTSGTAIMTQDFPGTFELASIFDIQRRVTARVADALSVTVGGDEAGGPPVYPTASLDAYRAFVEGRQSLRTRTKASLEKAKADFREAVLLDSSYALAHVGLADANVLLAQHGGLTAKEQAAVLNEAQASIDAANTLDPWLAEAFTSQAAIYLLTEDRDRAGAALQLAIERNPNDGFAHYYHGVFTMKVPGEKEKAVESLGRARVLDPLDAPAYEKLARISFQSGQFDAALSMAAHAVELDEDYPLGQWMLGQVELRLGRGDLALEHFDKMAQLNYWDENESLGIADAYQAVGLIGFAQMIHSRRVDIAPTNASRHLRLGDFYRDIGRLEDAEVSYTRALQLERGDPSLRIRSRLVVLALDRDDVAAADRLVTEIEAAAHDLEPRSRRFALVARLNLDMFRGQFSEGAAVAQQLGAGLRSNYSDWEPVSYFGVLAGRPADSRQVLKAFVPALIAEEDPSIDGVNVNIAVDLAAVLMRTGEQGRADLLLRKSEAFLATVAEVQRRNQFRMAQVEIHALQGRTAEALAGLREAIDAGWRDGWWRLEHKPHFESLRANSTFLAMVAEIRSAVRK